MEHPKIETRCPTCGSNTLFIGTGGLLTCSNLDCRNPDVGAVIAMLVRKADALDEIEGSMRRLVADMTTPAPAPGRNAAGQVVDHLHSNAAGQRYMMPPDTADTAYGTFQGPDGPVFGMVDVKAANSLRAPTPAVDTAHGTFLTGMSVADLLNLDSERCTAVLNGVRCSGRRFHADSMQPTKHSFKLRTEFTRELPDDPASSRRRGSAGNFEEMNNEVIGPLSAREKNGCTCSDPGAGHYSELCTIVPHAKRAHDAKQP